MFRIMGIISTKNELFKKVTWAEVRDVFRGLNSELADIIDELNPSDEHTLYIANYRYGSHILKKGKIHFPDENGNMISIQDTQVPAAIQEDLGYNYGTNPVSMILENTAEIFVNTGDRIIPLYGLIPPGKIFSTWMVLNQPNPSNCQILLWDMTAGVRSIFMLQKANEKQAHSKLRKKFHIQTECPRNLTDQWDLFKEIANHESFGKPWSTKTLFFGKKWFEHMSDPKWMRFYFYLYRTAWLSSDYWRNQFTWDMVFSLIEDRRKVKPSPYILNTARYLLGVGVGASPGFSPGKDGATGPIDRLVQAYGEVYKMKGYPPTFLTPSFFDMGSEPEKPVYYSLNFPTSIEYARKSRERSSLITDLIEVKWLLNLYISELLADDLRLEYAPLYAIAKKVSFDFFHSEATEYRDIKLNSFIPEEDQSFPNSDASTPFPTNSPFMRACIRIKNKKTT
jgi:hypothetical protein